MLFEALAFFVTKAFGLEAEDTPPQARREDAKPKRKRGRPRKTPLDRGGAYRPSVKGEAPKNNTK